jgi:hypothetical protein
VGGHRHYRDCRATVVHAAEASAKEATIAWESATTFIKEVEDWAAIAEREA